MSTLENQNRLATINTEKTDRSADTATLFLGEKLDIIAAKLDVLISHACPQTSQASAETPAAEPEPAPEAQPETEAEKVTPIRSKKGKAEDEKTAQG